VKWLINHGLRCTTFAIRNPQFEIPFVSSAENIRSAFWAFLDENSTSDVPAGHEVIGLGTHEKITTKGVAK
jgi:hypothetical protein